MNYISISALVLILLTGCNSRTIIVEKSYADSLIMNYPGSEALKKNHSEIQFWKGRIDPQIPGISNELKYAASLVRRFQLTGDINDLSKAEKILIRCNEVYQNKEAGVYLALTEIALLQHQFKDGERLLNEAKKLGIQNYVSNSFSFDVEYELGHYSLASFYLDKLKSPADYGYHFRKAKLSHLNGEVDTAIHYMLRAAGLAPMGSYLQGAALANAADFYIHTGELETAAGLYKQCILINSNDIHSISGLGTIAMKYDRDYAIARSLFNLVKSKYKLPDPAFKLYQLAQSMQDSGQEKLYAQQFVSSAGQPRYGKMYSKYLIEIYTGILNKPMLAEQIAREELDNRLTPQTAAWYAWALYRNKKPRAAEKIYKKHVSGKPLEGFELYYMGKLMEGLGKDYLSGEFYKAASKNKFDLSPAMILHLDSR